MTENYWEINKSQLRKALQQAVLPAEEQIAKLKGFPVADEIADDLGNQIDWVLQCPDAPLSEELRVSLSELDALLDQMSGPHNAHLWTDEALRSRPEWDEVRRRARRALELFGWPYEDEDVPPDERVMLKEALRVAALPAERQIASYPKGSPVAEWIAGDFFNWMHLALMRSDFSPTDEQRAALRALDARLNEMSERHEEDSELWTEQGLRGRPEWEEVRRDARRILELFQWEFEEDDGGGNDETERIG